MHPMEDGAAAGATATARGLLAGETLSLDFEEFFRAHHVELYRALWLLVRNRHEAEEIMQDSFLRLWERWPRVRTHPNPTGYLYRTAMNLFRSRRRRAGLALRKAVGTLPPDDELAMIEERDAVIRALAPLPERQRAAVVLVDVLGLTGVEAAEALGVRPATVRVLLGRARSALREVMSTDG